MPTLIVHGTDDKTVPIDATARAVAKAVPHAQLIEYGGEAHGVFATQTERLKSDLLAFLRHEEASGGQVMLDEMTRETLVTPQL